MSRKKNRKGFTLIEMLMVIAIIAILVAIVIPIVNSSTDRSEAATDAANLRAVLAALNVDVLNGNKTVNDILADAVYPTSKFDSNAVLTVVYNAPGFIDVFYVNSSTYYSLDYFSDYATNGTSSLSTAEPTVPAGSVWYTVQGE